MTLPLRPGSARLMITRDSRRGLILDAEVFFTTGDADAAAAKLTGTLDAEFRDYHPDWEDAALVQNRKG
jgi:hypothetical protein